MSENSLPSVELDHGLQPQSHAVLGSVLNAPEKPVIFDKKGGKTNTERSREYRLNQKQSGGSELSVFIGGSASAAIQIIRANGRLTQTKAIEDALILRAMQISPDAKTTYGYLLGGGIDASCAQVWGAHCEKTKQLTGPSIHTEVARDLSTHSGIQN